MSCGWECARLGQWLREHRERVFLGLVLMLSSSAGLTLLAVRFWYSGNAGYRFMVWNLLLAWVPLGLGLVIAGVERAGRAVSAGWAVGPAMAGLAVLWLLFYPNAPYLLTEFVHLDPDYAVRERPIRALAGVSPGRAVPVWYDVGLILTFAWNGLLLGFVALWVVQNSVRRRFGAAAGWATAVVVLGLSGFGISLGRFERWNSWDLFFRPGTLLADVAARVSNPLEHARTTAVTLLLGAFLMLAYLSMAAIAATRPERSPGRVAA